MANPSYFDQLAPKFTQIFICSSRDINHDLTLNSSMSTLSLECNMRKNKNILYYTSGNIHIQKTTCVVDSQTLNKEETLKRDGL